MQIIYVFILFFLLLLFSAASSLFFGKRDKVGAGLYKQQLHFSNIDSYNFCVIFLLTRQSVLIQKKTLLPPFPRKPSPASLGWLLRLHNTVRLGMPASANIAEISISCTTTSTSLNMAQNSFTKQQQQKRQAQQQQKTIIKTWKSVHSDQKRKCGKFSKKIRVCNRENFSHTTTIQVL